MMAPQVLQLGASPMLYMDCMALAVWKTLRSTVVSRGLPSAMPLRAVRSLEMSGWGSPAIPCWGGVRSEYWKASPWSSWVAGAV